MFNKLENVYLRAAEDVYFSLKIGAGIDHLKNKIVAFVIAFVREDRFCQILSISLRMRQTKVCFLISSTGI